MKKDFRLRHDRTSKLHAKPEADSETIYRKASAVPDKTPGTDLL